MLSETRFETVPIAELRRMGIVIEQNAYPRNVLIVDSDRIITDTRVAILSRCGYAAYAAYDVESALEIARLCPPEIFVCDLAMPRMNGVALARKIRLLAPECKVILISDFNASSETLEAAANEGFGVNLNRPVHPAELATLLDSL